MTLLRFYRPVLAGRHFFLSFINHASSRVTPIRILDCKLNFTADIRSINNFFTRTNWPIFDINMHQRRCRLSSRVSHIDICVVKKNKSNIVTVDKMNLTIVDGSFESYWRSLLMRRWITWAAAMYHRWSGRLQVSPYVLWGKMKIKTEAKCAYLIDIMN